MGDQFFIGHFRFIGGDKIDTHYVSKSKSHMTRCAKITVGLIESFVNVFMNRLQTLFKTFFDDFKHCCRFF